MLDDPQRMQDSVASTRFLDTILDDINYGRLFECNGAESDAMQSVVVQIITADWMRLAGVRKRKTTKQQKGRVRGNLEVDFKL